MGDPVGDELVVEHAPGDRVHAEVDLVEDRQVAPGGESEDRTERGALPGGQLLGLLPERDLEPVEECVGVVRVPARPQHGRELEGDADPLVLHDSPLVPHEADAARHLGVLPGRRAVEQDGTGLDGAQRRDEGGESRLAGTVAPHEAGDGAGADGHGDVVERGRGAEAVSEAADLEARGGGGGHRVLLMWSMIWSVGIPNVAASASTGSSERAKKVARPAARSLSRAPGSTNMPSPRRFSRSPSSTSWAIAFAAVAGLMRYVVAYCVVDMTCSPSDSSPERMAPRIRSAICW